MTSKFSVLCSLYHKEKPEYLEQCFESLKWQTLEADQVVVVHDGPLTPELYATIDNWKQRLPITEVRLSRNVGLGEALNKGLEKCRFDLVARVDTDDINHIDRFEKQIKHLDSRPDISVLSCNINEFEKDPNFPSGIRAVPQSDTIRRYSLKRNPINHMAVVFRKKDVLKVGSYKHLHFMEDYYLWLRIQANGMKIENLNDCLVSARVGNGMLERRKGVTYARSEFNIMLKMYRLKLTRSPFTMLYFSLRALSRLLPASALSSLYQLSRKN